jgi:hypothetical protein
MTYRLTSGEQYVAIAVGGGGPFGEGDAVVAFRLGGRGTSFTTQATSSRLSEARRPRR